MPRFKIPQLSRSSQIHNRTAFFCTLFLGACVFYSTRAAAQSASSSSLPGTLDLLSQTVQVTNNAIGHLRVDKWKADNDAKSATQTRVDSLSRNMTNALPALIQEARQKPQDSAVVFKLYRNLNALYDVLSSVTEATGAFGAKQDYDALATQTAALQDEQRAVADYLESLTAQNQAELARYHAQQQAQAAATPRKIIVDGQPTPVKRTRKATGAHPTPTPQ